MIWHSSDKNEVLSFFGVEKDKGLSSGKAELILSEIKNESAENKISLLAKSLAKQFNNITSLVLLIAVVLSAIVSVATTKTADLATMMIIVVMAIFGVVTVVKNYFLDRFQHEVDDHKKYSATVLRDGTPIVTTTDGVVPGDILILKGGDLIPADARLIEDYNLRCDEYVLTGEIVYVDKDSNFIADDISEIKERKNMVFAGCSVMSGQALAVVTDIGEETELAREKANKNYIYKEKHSDTAAICRYSGIVVTVICSIIFLLNLIFNGGSATQNFALTVINSIINCTAIAIACYPESLPGIISAIKSIGIRKLQEVNTYILKPSIIKKASKISVICADKGEVFTTNKMSVAKVFDGRKITTVTDAPLDDSDSTLLKLSSLCYDSENPDPADLALLDISERLSGIPREDMSNLYPTLSIIPFDNERKLVTTVKMVNGKPFAIVKGAPEQLVTKCNDIDGTAALKVNELMAQEALRVIAVGYKELTEVPAIPNTVELENDLIFAGFIGFETELSEEVVKTVRALEKASIRTIMITGDNLSTAKAIARRVGILHDNLKAITNEELSAISDEDLDREITSYAVFARITPENRFRIVKALQHNNEKVAITGSSVFDAPSLRKATVGIALTESASDVAKDASDMILGDTSLLSITRAIATCKNTYISIRHTLHYILSSNLGELLTFLFGLLIFKTPILLAAPLLLVNLITDTFPALSIGMTPVDSVKISNDKTSIFTLKSTIKVAIESVIITILAIIGYSIGNGYSQEIARTVVFAIIGFIQILHIISCYSSSFIFSRELLKNKYIIITALISAFIMILILATPIRYLFGLALLPGTCVINVIIISLIFLIADESIKFGFKLYGKIKK